jgi:hypothetical protein
MHLYGTRILGGGYNYLVYRLTDELHDMALHTGLLSCTVVVLLHGVRHSQTHTLGAAVKAVGLLGGIPPLTVSVATATIHVDLCSSCY